FDRWARAVDEAGKSQTPRLLFEMAAVDLAAAEPLLPLGELLERLDALEVRLSGGAAAGPRAAPAASPPSVPTSAPPAPPAGGARSWASPPAVARPAPA